MPEEKPKKKGKGKGKGNGKVRKNKKAVITCGEDSFIVLMFSFVPCARGRQ